MTGKNATDRQLKLAAFMAGVSRKILVPLNAAAGRTESAAPAFYCVHAITGAGVTDFAPLARSLEDRVRFFAIRAPKALMLAADYDSLLTSIARQYAEAIDEFQPFGPIHLGGWSSGALVALETSRELRKRGREVGLLVSLDGAPKNTPAAASPLDYLVQWIENLPAALASEDIGRLWGQVRLKAAQAWAGQETRAAGDDAAHPIRQTIANYSAYPAHQRRFMRALFDTLERTRFGEYEGEVVVYRATIQPIWLSGVAEFWRRTALNCEIVEIRATHARLVSEPAVLTIAADLARRLEARGRIDPPAKTRRAAPSAMGPP